MTPQLMAMLNGMYGGIPSDTNGIMPLGSGFAGQQLPQQDVQPQMPQQGGMPNMPLGSGMYGMGAEAAPQGNFALGSGLYGQQMPSLQDMQQGGQPQAPAGATPSTEDKFSQLMNNPMFQYGMGLVGAMHTTNPWGGGMTAFLQAQGQQAKIKQANAAMLAEQQRIALLKQEAELKQRQYEEAAPQREANLGLTGAQTGQIGAQTGMIPSEIAKNEAATGFTNAQAGAIPYHTALETAQAANLTQEAQINQQKFNIMMAQAPVQMSIYQKINWAMQHMGGANNTTPAQPSTPGAPTMQPQSAPAPQGAPQGGGEWAKRTTDYRANQPTAANEQAAIISQELSQETDPANRAALNRELARLGGAGDAAAPQQAAPTMQPVVDQQGQAPAAQGQPAANGSTDPLFWGQLGMGMGAVGMPGGAQAQEYGKMLTPQSQAAGAYVRNPATGEYNYMPDPAKVAELKISSDKAKSEIAHTNQETTMAKGKVAETQAADRQTLQDSTASLDRLAKGAQALVQFDAKGNVINQHPGLEHNAGLQGMFGLQKATQSGRDAAAQIDMLKNQLMVDTMGVLRSASKSGSTGMGQLNQSEGDTLRGVIANLQTDKGQSLGQLQQQLKQVQEFAVGAKQRMAEKYNSLYANENNPSVAPSIGANTADVGRPAQAAAPTGKLAPPKAGEVRGNYVFLGGDRDPADPKSWAPAPKGK